MNQTQAIGIVRSINPDADEFLITQLLEESRAKTSSGAIAYRPYIVGARTLYLNPPNSNLKKADTLEWFDWTSRADYAMSMQSQLDSAFTGIPLGWESTIPMMTALVSSSGLL